MAKIPPDVPPRVVSSSSSLLSPNDCYRSPYLNYAGIKDPRSSSTQSLQPTEIPGPNRRTLLIIYIHGFLGSETSFQSLPAHIHVVLTTALAETHVIHTKIYPRYKSRGTITAARDDFSRWLHPHESPKTDIVLIGHSLGGILAADVVLIPSTDRIQVLRHRIIGMIAYDTPFLGMHHGVVKTGIANLFRSTPENEQPISPDSISLHSSTISLPEAVADPNYNPIYSNDVHLANRSGKFQRGMYFFMKHQGNLAKATNKYVTSHLQFGGCLADYQGLRNRYEAIRALEDVDEMSGEMKVNNIPLKRVRFVNYYSASTGRIRDKSPIRENSTSVQASPEMQHLTPRAMSMTSITSQASSPKISLEEVQDYRIITKSLEELNIDEPLESADSNPIQEENVISTNENIDPDEEIQNALTTFPSIPEPPQKPPDFNPSQYRDKDTLKLAQKEYNEQVKAYERANKEREKIIKRREKFVEGRKKTAEKAKEKADKVKQKQHSKELKKQLRKTNTTNIDNNEATEVSRENVVRLTKQKTKEKTPKDRKFCALPKRDPNTGIRDSTWIRVYMPGMDEVVAHTSMFKPGEIYSKLVTDTIERIEGWVQEDATMRAIAMYRE